ncbi:unnamed protein product, partial [Didymodactylos carnosus]
PAYPLYFQRNVANGYCLFNLVSINEAAVQCTNDTNPITIPNDLTGYFTNVTKLDFTNFSLSTLPAYVCSLKLTQIDLSNQLFTQLTDSTFPCLDQFQYISLADNNINTVSITNNNFATLTTLDLSGNDLVAPPYTLLSSSLPLKNINLQDNLITSMDLWLYAFGSSIDLTDNPMTNTITNYQNITLSSSVSIASNISLPSSTFIIDDSISAMYGICNVTNIPLFRSFLQALDQSSTVTILVNCTCASIHLKNLYPNITNDFSCSNSSDNNTFLNLQSYNCTNTNVITTGLCTFQNL